MIKLYHSTNKDELIKKFEYKEDDILNPKNISAYEFVVENNKTIIEPLTLRNDGFEVPQFNKALIDLANETIEIGDNL
jgi:hypothetical protein